MHVQMYSLYIVIYRSASKLLQVYLNLKVGDIVPGKRSPLNQSPATSSEVVAGAQCNEKDTAFTPALRNTHLFFTNWPLVHPKSMGLANWLALALPT